LKQQQQTVAIKQLQQQEVATVAATVATVGTTVAATLGTATATASD